MNIFICLKSSLLAEALGSLIQDRRRQDVVFLKPDLATLDITKIDVILTDCADCSSALQERGPQAKALLIDTGLSQQDITCLLLCHKFNGVISNDQPSDLFFKALDVVCSGQIWLDQKHMKDLMGHRNISTPKKELLGLSSQDRKIVELISLGFKNREIADQLCLAEQTIKAHVSRIFQKLDVANRSQLVRLVTQNPPPPAQDYPPLLSYHDFPLPEVALRTIALPAKTGTIRLAPSNRKQQQALTGQGGKYARDARQFEKTNAQKEVRS